MDKEPKPGESLNYEEALAQAEADPEGWVDAQTWTLEDYLMRRSGEMLDARQREQFQADYLAIKDITITTLTQLGEKYNLLADFDLQSEGLKVYCRRKNITLVTDGK